MAATSLASIMSAGNSVATSYSQSKAIQAKGAYEKQQYETNSELANMQSKDAEIRGEADQANIKKKTAQEIGAQRAHLAAQGIDINSGSAADVQTNTATLGALDALTAKNNAWRESFGFQVKALNDKGNASFVDMAAETNSRNTLLTGGMNALAFGAKGAYEQFGGSPGLTVPKT